MSRNLSLYLDLVRFLAALTVFMAHAATKVITGSFLWQFQALGGQAVVIFFVLSGFVIAYVADGREPTLGLYAESRAARIYSVALPAILLTFILDTIGAQLNPVLYFSSGLEVSHHPLLIQILSNVLFVRENWFIHVPIGSNYAYWSIGYEVWYYIIFGAWTFSPARLRLVITGLAALAAGPKILSMFPIWLFGVATYHLCRSIRLPRYGGGLALALSTLLFIAYQFHALTYGRLSLDLAPGWIRSGELPEDYLIGLLFSVNILGFSALFAGDSAPFLKSEAAIRWTAGATFTMYLMHVPIMIFLTALSPWPVTAPAHRAFVLVITLAAVFILAEVSERRKSLWKRWIRQGTALLFRLERASQHSKR